MKTQQKIILILLISMLFNFVLLSGSHSPIYAHSSPVDDPVVQWSSIPGSTLTGPEAPLSVSWTGGENEIVNNTLEISKGDAQISLKGEFLATDQPSQIFQFHIDLIGLYYCELSWDDPLTDIDAYISSSPSFGVDDCVFKNYYEMASLDFPETGYAEFDEGDYWVEIDWYDGYVPVEYQFFIGSKDFYYWNNTVSGPNQTITTEFLMDSTYRFTSICFDSAGNKFSSSANFVTNNQFSPVIEWIKVNGVQGGNIGITRGSNLVIEWESSDLNVNETVFATMHYTRPGSTSYSLLFSSWTASSYTVNWDSSKFADNGVYWFKLVVSNEHGPTSLPTYFNFFITEDTSASESTACSTNETKTVNDSTTESSTVPFYFSIFTILVISVFSVILKRKRI